MLYGLTRKNRLVMMLCFIVFQSYSLFAQPQLDINLTPSGTFQGTVNLSDQSIHSGIYVFIEGTSFVGVTDQNGIFVIDDVPYGTYTLNARIEGYSIAQISNQNISLAGTVVQVPLLVLNPVVDIHQTFSAAHQQSTRGDDQAAVNSFTQIMNNYPGTPLAIESEYQVAFIHYTQDQYIQARDEFNTFISKYANSDLIPSARYWLARALSNAGDLRGAAGLYRTIVAQSPQNERAPFAQYNLARIYEKIATADSAIASYQTILNTFSNHSLAIDAQYNIGTVYLSHDKYDQALAAFQKVINDFPSGIGTYADAYYQVAYTHYKKVNYATAINTFRSFLTTFSNNDRAANAQYYIAYSYYSAEDYTQAINEFDKVILLFPKSDKLLSARFYKAMSYYNKELFDQAIPFFQEVFANHPDSDMDVTAHYYLAVCKFESETYSYTQAQTEFANVLSQAPGGDYAAKAQYKIGWCHYYLDDFPGAITAFQNVITNYPQSSQVAGSYYWMAFSSYNQTTPDYPTAISYWQHYATMLEAGNKNGGEAWYYIGRSYEKLATPADLNQAVIAYETIINTYPNCKRYNEAVTRRNLLLGL